MTHTRPHGPARAEGARASGKLAIVTPTERPGARARALWRTNAVVVWLVIAGLLCASAWYIGWSTPLRALGIVLAVVAFADIALAPEIRFRVHRYQVGTMSVISRSGWAIVQHRIAPIARIQTVDVQRGPTARLFGLATVVVSTASSAGAIRIVALEVDVAADLADDLLQRTELGEGVDGQ